MTNASLYYQESGRLNPGKYVVTTILGVALAIILGYVYSLLIYFIPLVYFNVIICFGFGVVMGGLVMVFSRFGDSRNQKGRIVQSLIFSLVAYYFHWVAYLIILINGEVASPDIYFNNLFLSFDPAFMLELIMEINAEGVWSMFGINFTGGALLTVWVIEALLILGIPIVMVLRFEPLPFSELNGKWYPKFTLKQHFYSATGSDQWVRLLADNPVKTIDDLGLGKANRYGLIHLYVAEKEKTQYISIESVYIDTGEKGKKETETVVLNLGIDTDAAKEILQKYEHKKERLKVF